MGKKRIMLMEKRGGSNSVVVTLGFAADAQGNGVAFGRVRRGARESSIRVAFVAPQRPVLEGRDTSYAALRATAEFLRERGVREAIFRIADGRVVEEVRDRTALPTALLLPYIALRCSLNRFADFSIASATDDEVADLLARARAEVSLHVAA